MAASGLSRQALPARLAQVQATLLESRAKVEQGKSTLKQTMHAIRVSRDKIEVARTASRSTAARLRGDAPAPNSA
jgi:hypothetical protein